MNIDKLFHEKLTSYEVQPSTEAWSRIETAIPKKQNKSIWYFAAAASVTIVLASAYLMLQTNTIEDLSINSHQIVTLDESPVPNSITEASPVLDKKIEERIEEKKTAKTTNSVSESIAIAKSTSESMIIKEYSISELHIPLDKRTFELNLDYAQLMPEFESLPENKTDLTLPENESGFRKVYEYALRVKNGEENPVDLRKAKEELFAMAKSIKFNQSKTN